MATIINGKDVAASVIDQIKSATNELQSSAGVQPGLAVVLVGADPASQAYVGSKSKMAKECGFKSVQHSLPEDTKQEDLMALVAELNADPSIHGILVQLPLPKHLDSEPVIQSILPEKDVDGLHVVNAGKLATGDSETGLISCTPAGALILVRQIRGDDLSGLNAVVIGRSNLFGKPMAEPGLPTLVDQIEALDKPVIAAVHGTALGGGCEVALASHYRIAVPSAKFGLPEVKLGILPGAGGTQRLPRVAGVEVALEMAAKGDPISAKQAQQAGLVDRLAGEDSLLADALAYAAEVADARPLPRAASVHHR